VDYGSRLLSAVALPHPQADVLAEIVLGQTNVSSSGFPYISDRSFELFIDRVPHLFCRGNAALQWLRTLEGQLPSIEDFSRDQVASAARAIKVLHTVICTAGITAPPDLWLLKQVLAAHNGLGIVDALISPQGLNPTAFSRQRGFNERHLRSNLNLVYSRGYLKKTDTGFVVADDPRLASVLVEAPPIEDRHRINFVPVLTSWFRSGGRREGLLLKEWLRIDVEERPTGSWIADQFQIELGYRLVPVVLSLRVCDLTKSLIEGTGVLDSVPRLLPEIVTILEYAGMVEDGRVTELGARVFERGPGPFGIIGAYHPYLNNLRALLTSESSSGVHVQRGENVAASQDANRKTFQEANDRLDAFCKKYDFQYSVFIEHAVGRGEATRQRFQRSGDKRIRFFGADLEDSAVDQAIDQRNRGVLPANMEFIRSADIGNPSAVVDFLAERGLAGQSTVMMVGNGFHEIRQQTNLKMIEVFKAYQDAGFILIFTEESALENSDLLQTAWNTYHAGFRYVHELSGQGLRPAIDRSASSSRWSWRKCASQAGYTVLEEFSYKSRSIYPYKRPERDNPSISETYFCVPRAVCGRLGLKTDH
jgi:hypothetical protein